MTNNDHTASNPDALTPGYRFDELEIQQVVDTTCNTLIYRAWDTQLERQLLIHEFMPRTLALRGDDAARLVLRSKQDAETFASGLTRFTQQARQLAQFTYPSLPHVLRLWPMNDTAYTAMPLYSGVTLAELQRQQPELFNDEWIRRMLPMVCGALATLHDAGVLHRDLSLKSIQIQDNGIPLLLNTAASWHKDGLRDSGKMLHPGFAPLEQYTDDLENLPGPWTDIYALGAILYTLITGTCPPASVTRSIQDSCKPLAESQPAGYSTSLLQAVDRALALKPEDRPQSVAAFAELAGINVGEIGDVTARQETSTMMIPTAEPEVAPPVAAAQRTSYSRIVLAIIGGAIIGLIAGWLLFSRAAPPAASAPAAQTAPVAQPAATPEPAGAAISRVYIRAVDGDQVEINGNIEKLSPAISGYGTLQLAAGEYHIVVISRDRQRSATLKINHAGTWLVNPQ